jgi:hypothetical protein
LLEINVQSCNRFAHFRMKIHPKTDVTFFGHCGAVRITQHTNINMAETQSV